MGKSRIKKKDFIKTAYNKLIGGFIICGFVGFTNFNNRMSTREEDSIVREMCKKLHKMDEAIEKNYTGNKIGIGNYILDNKQQNMIYKYQDNTYAIAFSGVIYNLDEIRKKLVDNDFKIEGKSDAEILLKAFIFYGYDVVKHLNGVFSFAIWNEKKEEVFLARDHFGVKPLFYSIKNNEIVFASEIKALFEFPSIYPCLDENGVSEIFGIGPAHSPGITVFKDIFELKPANYIIFNNNYFIKEQYWKFVSKEHKDDFKTTCDKIEYLIKDSIKQQSYSDKPICTFLSGGLDSSIITKYVYDNCEKRNSNNLRTFSVDYKDNDINFRKTEFQPDSDNKYIEIFRNNLNINHSKITIDTPELVDSLEEAMIARDMPGMADVDASLLLLCKKVKPYSKVVLTGECADEIFAGYPWFFREDALKSNTFPWSINIDERQKLLKDSLKNKVDLKSYVNSKYNESLLNVDFSVLDSKDTLEKRKISYLTMNWFMQTLLDRSDRMAMSAGIEIRVPFCDYRIAEYLWNVPWEMKAYKGREKGLLRHIMKGKISDEIVTRKKSPYPKTWNPTYLKSVKEKLTTIMNSKEAPIKQLINESVVKKIIETDGMEFKRPWFGQLMTGPQLMAYLCQINMWLEKYKPIIEI